MFNLPLRQLALIAFSLLAFLSNTSVSAQEARMIVSHEVEDFARWKQVFDQALPIRRSAGEMAFEILQSPTDRTLVTVWFEWDTMERARAWASDPALANGMAAAGVVSAPTFSFSVIGAAD